MHSKSQYSGCKHSFQAVISQCFCEIILLEGSICKKYISQPGKPVTLTDLNKRDKS